MASSLVGIVLGFVIGARHALEPDHLAAVAVLVSERPGARRAAWLGALWGVGHTLALVAVGLVLALASARTPERLSAAFEFGVAVMLVVLGLRAIGRAAHEGTVGPVGSHMHAGVAHSHPAPGAHVHFGRRTLALRPLLVGVVHGLAGSGALTALVIAELPTVAARGLFVLLFGLGSVAGMMALSGLAGWPLARIARRPAAARLLCAATGAISVALGIARGGPLVGHILS
jgi:hypothetical protein